MSSIQGSQSNDPLIVSRLLSGETTKLPAESKDAKNAKAAATKAAGKSQESEVSKEKGKTTSTSQKSSATAIPTPDANGTTSTAKASRSFFSKQLSDTDLSTQDTLKKAYEDLQQSERNVTALQRQIKEYENNPGLSHEKKAKFIENANQRLRQAQFELGSVKNKLFTIQNKIEDSNKQIHAKLFKNLDKVLFQLGMKIQTTLSQVEDPGLVRFSHKLLSDASTRLDTTLKASKDHFAPEVMTVITDIAGQINYLRKTISKNQTEINEKIDVLEKKLHTVVDNLFSNIKIPANILDTIRYSLIAPDALSLLNSLVDSLKSNKTDKLTYSELFYIHTLLNKAKSRLEDQGGQKDTQNKIQAIKAAQDIIKNEMIPLKEKVVEEALATKPEVRQALESLQNYLGRNYPIDLNTKFALIKALESREVLDSLNNVFKLKNAENESVTIELVINSFRDAIAQVDVEAEVPFKTGDNLKKLITILCAKAGYLPNAQLVTDGFELAYLTVEEIRKKGNMEATTNRYLFQLSRSKDPAFLQSLSGQEKELVSQGFIETAYTGVSGKTSWSKIEDEQGLKLSWEGGFALPGQKPLLSSLSIDLTPLGKMNKEEAVNCIQFMKEWLDLFAIRKEAIKGEIYNAFEKQDASLIPREFSHFFSNADKHMWKAGMLKFHLLTGITDKFQNELDEALLDSLMTIGT